MFRTLLSVAFCTAATVSVADDYQSAMKSYLETEITGWASAPQIVAAINAQNANTAHYNQADIDALDAAWRTEIGGSDTPTISAVLDTATSDYLRQIQQDAGGVISEIFVMDARGLNVATSSVTSDYWQGDEAKFQKTHDVGAGAIHLGDVEFDESSQSYQGQVSMAIVDPASNQVIGAITVGLNAEALF